MLVPTFAAERGFWEVGGINHHVTNSCLRQAGNFTTSSTLSTLPTDSIDWDSDTNILRTFKPLNMDINSLLSPQDSPAGSPSPKSRSPVSRRSKAPTPSVRASPLSQSSTLTSFPQPSAPSTPANSLTQNTKSHARNSNAASTSPRGTPKISQQKSTSGMDTLAELASMQHHQHTARTNPGGLRNAEAYDARLAAVHNKSSNPIRPSLQAIARTHSGSRSSLDIAMTDAPTQAPPPRAFTSSSLSEHDLEKVGQLVGFLVENPNAYDSHVQLIKILHQGLISHMSASPGSSVPRDPRRYELLGDLQQAYEAMASRFNIGEELWMSRLQAQKLLANTVEDCPALVELYEKALSEEIGSTSLWSSYGEWITSLYSAANPSDHAAAQLSKPSSMLMRWSDEEKAMARDVFDRAQILDVWKRGAEDTKFNINDSCLTWDEYTSLLLEDLGASPRPEAISAMKSHFVERLQIPHAQWDDTFMKFSNFTSSYENSSYEETMVAISRQGADAKARMSAREEFESRLQRTSGSGDMSAEWTCFAEYLGWEMSLNRKKKLFSYELTNALFQRALLKFPMDPSLWEDYLVFLGDELKNSTQGQTIVSVLNRACGHCPWSGNLWAQYIQAAERVNLPFPDIGQIKHKATSTGLLDSSSMEDVLKIHTAWCSFLRRQAFQHDSTDEELDVAEVGIRSAIEDMETLGRKKYGKEYKGDPQYRLERIYIKFLGQCRNYNGARDTWKGLIARHGDSYEFWLRYYMWEMITWARLGSDETSASNLAPREATRVLHQAAKRTQLDWPEKILDTYLHHCEDHEDAAELQLAAIQCRKASKAIVKRRQQEAVQAAELARQQQASVDGTELTDQGPGGGKRKREEVDERDESAMKKSRSNNADPQTLTAERAQSPQAQLKRDRENTTVIVNNLPSNVNEKRVRHFFRDV